MAELRVPDRFKSGIARVADLTQDGFDQLLAALKKAPSFKDVRELLAWIGSETPSVGKADLELMMNALVPMFRVQRNSDVSPTVFASDVSDSIGPLSERDLFTSRISLLIEESALDLVSSRIADAKQEVERNFCKLRILTDLRPAFPAERGTSPTDMAVIHNFQIGYHDGTGKHQEFYVSLDAVDLEKLKKAIALAEERASTLESMLEKSGIRLHR